MAPAPPRDGGAAGVRPSPLRPRREPTGGSPVAAVAGGVSRPPPPPHAALHVEAVTPQRPRARGTGPRHCQVTPLVHGPPVCRLHGRRLTAEGATSTTVMRARRYPGPPGGQAGARRLVRGCGQRSRGRWHGRDAALAGSHGATGSGCRQRLASPSTRQATARSASAASRHGAGAGSWAASPAPRAFISVH